MISNRDFRRAPFLDQGSKNILITSCPRLGALILRRSESFPNFMTVGALAIWGDACRRIPADAEGGGGEVARAELAPRARTTPRLATAAQYNVRPEPPPKGHGVGFRFSGPNLKF